MEMLSRIEVGSGNLQRAIELYRGDLTSLTAGHAVDILVLSAYPDDYTATDGSLVGALNAAGLSIAALASDKARDLRTKRACWLSKPIAGQPGFERILCFEPLRKGTPPERVDDIFDCLEQILLGDFRDASIAMPVVATGDMAWSVEEMVPALLNAAVSRLRIGLRLKQLKIVEIDPVKAARVERLFQIFIDSHGQHIAGRPRRQLHAPVRPSGVDTAPGTVPTVVLRRMWAPRIRVLTGLNSLARRALSVIGIGKRASAPPRSPEVAVGRKPAAAVDGNIDVAWDLFVSYSRADATLVDSFIQLLRSQRPGIQIFRDSEALRGGGDWISELADAIDSSRCFVAILTPTYFDSKWCKREFNAAILRDDQGDDELLYPIFLLDDKSAPTLYLTFNYIDCREADLDKLKAASERLIARLG